MLCSISSGLFVLEVGCILERGLVVIGELHQLFGLALQLLVERHDLAVEAVAQHVQVVALLLDDADLLALSLVLPVLRED